ncbi:MAG: DUF1028 domain-containing protein [Actinomycetales bacterium]
MTFSVVGRDGTSYGVAVASKFLAVGSAVPAAWAGTGAIATQAWANLAYRPQGGVLLSAGRTAAETVAELTRADPSADQRQTGVVSVSDAATFTGEHCMSWAGGIAEGDVAIQGNILTGPEVVDAMHAAWKDNAGARLAERLLAVVTAGDAAGGDRRGRQSAALLVTSPGAGYNGDDTEVDLRVDDHPNPVPELARLLELHRLYFDAPDEASLLPLEGDLAEEVGALLARAGHRGDDVQSALEAWAGVENFEERMRPGRIDPLVLEQLRQQVGGVR